MKYPLEPALVLDHAYLTSENDKLKLMKEMSVSNIGHHMQDPDLSFEHIHRIVHIMASLSSMQGNFSKESMKLPPAILNAIPDLIVKY